LGLGLLTPQAQKQAPLPRPDAPASADSPAPFPPGTIFVVDTDEKLHHFNAAAPGNLLGTVPITGLQPGEAILGIDFRPSTGQLYGLGSSNRLYVINAVTGLASPVGGGFSPPLNGADFGFDFDPTTDRIRVVADSEANLRLNPDTGAVEGIDSPINPAGNLVGSAYTNNFVGATTTTLYGIDSGTDQLVIQNPQSGGTITPVGGLGVDTTGLVGFDIATGTGLAYASLTQMSVASQLYTINLTSGVATLVGVIILPVQVRDLAVVTGPENVFAVTTGNNLLRFLSSAPGTILSKTPITGLQPGETVLGIDFRPANGQLYALGSTSRLYRLDPATGAATQVGAGPFSTLLSGTDFGVDFDPTADRLRVVSDAEQNLLIHPDLGTVVFLDFNLNPPGNVVAAAYANNFAGATTTTLYDIDSSSDLLLRQSTFGSLSAVGPLGVDTTGLTGFDIAPNGLAFASLTMPAASATRLYMVDLATGAATPLGAIGGGETIRDVAVRVYTEVIYGVTQVSLFAFNLISFNAATPGTILTTVAITGLAPVDSIIGIDFRPATGQLYAIARMGALPCRLYTINTSTGAATGGPSTTQLDPNNQFGFAIDFDPTSDQIRVLLDNEQNLRIDPNTGAGFTDQPLNPAGNITAAAYTNNFAGATTTRLYDVDPTSDRLFIQNPPNSGALLDVGSLTVDLVDVTPVSFDIASGSGNAYIAGYRPPASSPTLFRVNLVTGAATAIGVIPTGNTLIDISVALTPAMSGADTPGSFVPSSSVWFLRNANSAGAADLTFKFGPGGANLIPIRGDWDGDGDDTPGVYDRTTGRFFLRNSSSAGPAEVPPFPFGPGGPGFLPITGDWDGDGVDTVGVYDVATGGVFLKNSNAAGAADLTFLYGGGGGVPIAGDWNNDNVDTIGLYVPSTATFFLRNSNSSGPADVPPFTFGPPGLAPLAGDWNGDGTDTVGVHHSATASWFLKNSLTGGTADLTFTYGAPGALGLAGDWDNR
jgi:hypothetical protein